MNSRGLGKTGLQCSIVGLGASRLASAAGPLSQRVAERLIGTAQDGGINLIDTADSYGQGESEKILGAVLAGKRDKFIIVTKAGYHFGRLGGGLRLIKPVAKRLLKFMVGGKNLAANVRANVSRQDFSPEYIESAIHASLQRLRTDHIDVFLLHSPPADVVSEGNLFALLRRLKQAGKIRHFGISSPDPVALKNALIVPDIEVVELPVNPTAQQTVATLPSLQKANLGIIANQIFLSGKLISDDDERKKVFELHSPDAKSSDASAKRLLIQFALTRPGVSSILTGTTNPEHLKQNVTDALGPGSFYTDVLAKIAETGRIPPQ